MRSNRHRYVGLALIFFVNFHVQAQTDTPPPPNLLADPAFPNLDLSDLPDALENANASRLVELGTDLRKAEKANAAKHKSVTAATLFAAAFKAAAFQGDSDTLKKLVAALDPQTDAELLGRVNDTVKLALPRRAATEKLSFTEEEIQSGVYATYRTIADNITLHASLADRQGLLNVRAGMFNGTELPDRLQKLLTARLQSALDAVSETSDADALAIAKLFDVSRGSSGSGAKGPITVSWLPGIRALAPAWDYRPSSIGKNEFIYDKDVSFSGVSNAGKSAWNHCNSRLGQKMGNGVCAGVPEEAFTKVFKKTINTGLGPNNLYGKLIATITPNDKSGASKILPGDMIQTEFATYKATYNLPGGGTKSWSSKVDKASQHISIARAVKNNGRIINTFEQNINSIQVEMIGIMNLDYMQTGRIWVLRAQ